MFFKRFFQGLFILFEGVSIIFKSPKLLWYILLPLLITFTVFVCLFLLTYNHLGILIQKIVPEVTKESWSDVILNVMVFLFSSFIIFFFTNYMFYSIAKIFAAPFNDLLSEKIETEHNPDYDNSNKSWGHFFRTLPTIVFEEVKKISLIVLGYVFLYSFALVPFLNVLFPVVFIIYSFCVIAIDFTDYSFSRHKMKLRSKILFFKRNFPEMLGFGGVVFLLFLIPFLGFLVIEISVISSTILFVNLTNKKII